MDCLKGFSDYTNGVPLLHILTLHIHYCYWVNYGYIRIYTYVWVYTCACGCMGECNSDTCVKSAPGQNGENGRHFADDTFTCIFTKKSFVFRFKFHLSLFLGVQFTISHNGPGNDSAPNRRQATARTKGDPVHRRIHAAHALVNALWPKREHMDEHLNGVMYQQKIWRKFASFKKSVNRKHYSVVLRWNLVRKSLKWNHRDAECLHSSLEILEAVGLTSC